MKVDVEEHLEGVFLGARKCLAKFKPVILFESSNSEDPVPQVLKDEGYGCVRYPETVNEDFICVVV